MYLKRVLLTSLFSLAATSVFADVCQTNGIYKQGQVFYGNVTCGEGTVFNIDVEGVLTLNGTNIQGTANVNGKLIANNAALQNVQVNGDFIAQNSKINGVLESTGSIYLNSGSVAYGKVTSLTNQIFIDSGSSIQGSAAVAEPSQQPQPQQQQ